MLTAEDIIERLGGAKKLSDELDIPLTTVASWKPVNFIPRWWQQSILAVAIKQGETLSTADFPTPEQRISRQTAKAA